MIKGSLNKRQDKHPPGKINTTKTEKIVSRMYSESLTIYSTGINVLFRD